MKEFKKGDEVIGTWCDKEYHGIYSFATPNGHIIKRTDEGHEGMSWLVNGVKHSRKNSDCCKFKLGDHVRIHKPKQNELPTWVSSMDIYDGMDLLIFEIGHEKGWIRFEPSGYWFHPNWLQKISIPVFTMERVEGFCITGNNINKKSPMKFKTIFNKLIDLDTRELVEAGYLDEELELTEEGWDALEAIVFMQHKEALVKAAKEKNMGITGVSRFKSKK